MKLLRILALRTANRLVAFTLRLGAPPVLTPIAKAASDAAVWFAQTRNRTKGCKS